MPSKLSKYQSWLNIRECAVCGARAIGINFGVLTCSPCKGKRIFDLINIFYDCLLAFFRRNAKKADCLKLACRSSHFKGQSNAICSDLRHCTSCRLRQCFFVGMKIQMIRSDEENQRYRELIQSNRERKRDVILLQENQQDFQIIPRGIFSPCTTLDEKDWGLLSNVFYAYENYCVQQYKATREKIFATNIQYTDEKSFYLRYHTAARVNSVSSVLSFLSSVPIVRSLSRRKQFFLCQHNTAALIIPNAFELEQVCFSEPKQLVLDRTAAQCTYGVSLFEQWVFMKQRLDVIIVNDPVITRLCLIILFFSTPLLCYFDPTLPAISIASIVYLNKIQNSFVNLLWNYLLHRQGYLGTIRILNNLIRAYLQSQKFLQTIQHQLQTQRDLDEMNTMLKRAYVFDNQEN
ncbi:unnamed protein product [Adineta ricciae]|uniref:Nuclear receptor domain-containing protein n=1 Tax=Adineta ricciae TaxID=249248 RepID=A0A814HQR1_ADIRI|nr:unnamed protein product [Adineta ricciae]CAF1272268.1 unnamed protein product [Adineta ricciae]